jgi:hypothetical protein
VPADATAGVQHDLAWEEIRAERSEDVEEVALMLRGQLREELPVPGEGARGLQLTVRDSRWEQACDSVANRIGAVARLATERLATSVLLAEYPSTDGTSEPNRR